MSGDFDPAPERDRGEAAFDPERASEGTPCAYTDYVRGDADPEALPATGDDADGLERAVWDALSAVEDPEMPISIVDLGLLYGVDLEARPGRDGAADADAGEGEEAESEIHATVYMTLTYTGCPARDMLVDEVREAAASPGGVDSASVELVWSPEWSLEMVTEEGRSDLREFGVSV